MANNNESNKNAKWLAILGAVAVVGLGGYLYTQNNKVVNEDTVVESTDSSVNQEEVDLLSTVIEADTADALTFNDVELSSDLDAGIASQLQILQENIDKAYNRNALVFLIMGEEDTDKVAQIYNSKHQSYTEYNTNASELTYERGKSLLITDTIERVKDLTVFDTLQGVLNLAKSNAEGVTVEVVTEDVYEQDLTSEVISITDEDVVTEAQKETESMNESEVEEVVTEDSETVESTDKGAYLYTQTRTSIVIERSALESYYNIFGEFTGNMSDEAWDSVSTDGDITNDYLIYDFMTTNVDDLFSAGEYLVIDGTEYISWYFDSYYSLDDWEVDAETFRQEGTIQDYIDMLGEFQTTTLSPIVNSLVDETNQRMAELEEIENTNVDNENDENLEVESLQETEAE